MNASKPTTTALARILALPLAAGLLAGCDYASKLPDAPTTLGYELQSKKPPSVTGIEAGANPAPRVASVPPRPVAVAPPAPVQTPPFPRPAPAPRIAEGLDPDPQIGPNLNTQALEVPNYSIEEERTALVVPPAPDLPAPQIRASVEPVSNVEPVYGPPAPQTGLARSSSVGAPPSDFPVAEYEVPQIGMSVESDSQFQSYEPVPFDASASVGGQFVEIQPVETQTVETQAYEPPSYDAQSFDTQSYEVAALPSAPEAVYNAAPAYEPQDSQILYSAPPLAAPLPYETVALPQNDIYSAAPAPTPNLSPIMVLHTRLPSGAVVTVHPIVGAPSLTSTTLARTIASELGAPVDASAASGAAASFDLRASASRASDTAEAEWKLFSSTGALVGVFGESQRSGTWTTMGDDALRAMGRRVADRLRRNADLRRATLTSVASVPSITSDAYAARLPSGAPSLAPMPRRRPIRGTTAGNAQPQQYVVNTQTLAPVPTRRPQGVRTAALPPLNPIASAPIAAPKPVISAPVALAPVTTPPAPVISQQVRAPQPLAPLGRALPSVPTVSAPPAAIPQPSFDTLRAAAPAAPDGPRALVFRGIRGAPGDGNQSLGREVSRLLAQSGAQLAPNGTPNALYLTADVSRSRGAGSDNIKITWHVEDASGTRIGQVVQENDVPTGQLDNSWGEDAFYAAQGARDGIMELLKSSGALDA